MVTLRFIAREDALATVPGARSSIGQPSYYIGRTYVAPDRKTGRPAKYEATKEPYEVTLDLEKQDEAIRFNRYVKIAQRGDIWPFDAQTAKLCGVALPAAEFNDGEWRCAPPPQPTPPGSAPADGAGDAPPLPATGLADASPPAAEKAAPALSEPTRSFEDIEDIAAPAKPTKKRS